MQVAMNGDQMTKPNRLPAIICFITLSWCHAASLDAQDTLRCIFYNVENFFDCHDNKEKDDEMRKFILYQIKETEDLINVRDELEKGINN